MTGKGSRPRPKAITEREWGLRHALTFNDWVPVSDERDVGYDGMCRLCAKPYLTGCACLDPDLPGYEYREMQGVMYGRKLP